MKRADAWLRLFVYLSGHCLQPPESFGEASASRSAMSLSSATACGIFWGPAELKLLASRSARVAMARQNLPRLELTECTGIPRTCWTISTRSASVVCREGTEIWSSWTKELRCPWGSGFQVEVTVGRRTIMKVFKERDQFAAELVYFSDCVLNDKEPQPSGREGLADVRVIQAMLESAESNRPISVPQVEVNRRPDSIQEISKKTGWKSSSTCEGCVPWCRLDVVRGGFLRRKHMAKYGKGAGKSVKSAMRRSKRGTLRSGKGGKGGRVKSKKQAIAIGLSEARKKGAKVPSKKG